VEGISFQNSVLSFILPNSNQGQVQALLRRWNGETKSAESMETSRTLIEIGVAAIEAMAVLLIASAFLWASVRFLVHTGRHAGNPYQRYKLFLGKALSLGLEFLVAADVIRTVTMALTFTNIGILGAIILARTFLSWSLVVEMEGRWPWQPAPSPSSEVTV
jgi:uncharacterized membrane protein